MKIFVITLLSMVFATSAEEAIIKEIQNHKADLDYCYKESGEKRKGTVVIDFEVNDKGEVTSTTPSIKSTIRNLSMFSCFASRLKQIKFPPAAAKISYTFDYSKE